MAVITATPPAKTGRRSNAQSAEFEFANLAGFDDVLDQLFKAGTGDAALAPAILAQHVIDRTSRPGGTYNILGTQRLERDDVWLQLEFSLEDGAPHALLVIFTIGKKSFAGTYTTHVKTFQVNRIALVADDHLGATSADVDHHASSAITL